MLPGVWPIRLQLWAMRRIFKIREDEVHRAAMDIHCHTSEMTEVAAKLVGSHAGQRLQLERERQPSGDDHPLGRG